MNRYALTWIQRSFLAVAFLISASVGSVQAQVDSGSILGTVTDPSGAVVSGARVRLTNEGTGLSLASTTGSEGLFKFSPVRIGSYKIEVVATGFKTATSTGIKVDIEASVVQNFKLQPGSVSETVEVTSAAPLLQSQDASVGQVVERQTVNDLPLNGRNFTFLAQLGAGVNTPQADTRGNASNGAFTANGQQPSLNNYLLDGIDNNADNVDFLNGTNFVVLPPVDAIQEFKVQTTDFSAQYGRSGAAILNATTKSGTNEIHGAVWEFFRNDKLDAANFFEDQAKIPKGDLQQNQFGFTIGGPVVIPHVFNGRNKVFFYADYEGLRRVQGTTSTGNVPTVAERNSGYTDFSDLIAAQTATGTVTDALGRTIPVGTIFDPASTRQVAAGGVDPVTGLTVPTSSGVPAGTLEYVRDPFYTGSVVGITNFTTQVSKLNQIPSARLDPNAVKMMNLYPLPIPGTPFFSNFASSPKLFEHSNAFDSRLDINFNPANSLFYRFSLKDDPQFIPGVFGGIADGGAFQQGTQTALSQQSALVYTHTFSATLVNEVHAGLNYLHTTRAGPEAGVDGIPAQFGIQDIPQGDLNGGLPAFGINGLSTLGSNNFLPSDEVSSTIQLTDDVTKIYRQHTFKMGFEWQHVKFSTLQPSWSHGQFNFDGNFTDVAGGADISNTGRADFLLTPTASTAPGGVNYLGGPDNIYASNISTTDDGKNYLGGYFQDDWKVSPKLTLNLGLRYDYFGQVFEHHHAQANFDPDLNGVPTEIIPLGNPNLGQLSASYTSLLAKDGISLLQTNRYGGGLGTVQKDNFAPRVGFAYQVTQKLVARGGFGIFYNSFENRGYSPNLGESYPFQFSFNYIAPNTSTPITFPACAATGNPNFTATLETGFGCTPLSPSAVNASGLALPGIQFNYQTPYSMGANFTLQYQIDPTLTFQAGWVTDQGRHIETLPNSNNVSTIAYYQAPKVSLVPFPDFGTGASYVATNGNSNYNGLQTQVEKRFTKGLAFLFTYTYSKVLTDARDALNQGSALTAYRAPSVPGFGIHGDYQLAPEDIRNVFHFSGAYELPFGKGKHFAPSSRFANQVVGGWSLHWISTFEGGQPISLAGTTAGSGCIELTAAGLGCGALSVPGQSVKRGLHFDSNGQISLFSNAAAAFTQPCVIGPTGQPVAGTPAGCAPLTGLAALGGNPDLEGPSFNRFDFSVFKNIPISERFRMEFRSEFFNIANHPNFNAPGFGGNGVVALPSSLNYTSPNFGEIGSTRDGSYDSREIQFALKLYF
jgi:hypothetical protein